MSSAPSLVPVPVPVNAHPKRIVVIGAAGRDFHIFNTVFRERADVRVVAFTAAQIPDIDGRRYPAELAGPAYPDGIPIVPESALAELIWDHGVDTAVFGYSDVTHESVMHLASLCLAEGADFELISAAHTMLRGNVPVIAVSAVRTGAGKSQTTRYLSRILAAMGKRVVVVRHPMPYGDLRLQMCQRFATYDDLDRQRCTIEEREEYEPHLDNGFVVYAGVDYERILRAAEAEADVVLWDGGNNDLPFFAPDLHVVVADPLRAGDELRYHPGETNVRLADVVLINKCDSASAADIETVMGNVRGLNPSARVLLADSVVTMDDPEMVRGRRALVVEDGPTLTHGSMTFGAGVVGARACGVGEIVDPRPYAVGSLVETYRRYPNAAGVLPAMGYGEAQVRDLEATIEAVDCDVVVSGTPIDLSRVLTVSKPLTRARYELREHEEGALREAVRAVVGV